jgi:phosphoribosyl-ATP pyrophosphohydrolase
MGLVPTIVQERRSRDVLMLAYSNAESLRRALTRGEGWYYSRSRQTLWQKGETSGHVQKLASARWDCDRDTVRFLVDQTGPTCHLGRPTCFGDGDHDVLGQLERLIALRRDGPPTGSYTQQLLLDPDRVSGKLREEVEEVITATSSFDVAWECADVLYHLMVHMAAARVDLDAVLRELRSRFKPDSPAKESGPRCGD